MYTNRGIPEPVKNTYTILIEQTEGKKIKGGWLYNSQQFPKERSDLILGNEKQPSNEENKTVKVNSEAYC